MIATLPMYDRPETAAANDRFWRAIRGALGHGPTHLTRDKDVWEVWTSDELLFAQTCGFPFRARLHGKVQLVGTPDYGLEGCPPGYYRSAVVVAADSDFGALADLCGRRFAFNDPLSQSGWAALCNELPLGFAFGPTVESGGHAVSARMVAEGQAEFAALDAVTFRLLQRYEDFAQNLRVVHWTQPTPGLPFITGRHQNAEAIASAVKAAISQLDETDADTLGIRHLVAIDEKAYLAVAIPPAPPR